MILWYTGVWNAPKKAHVIDYYDSPDTGQAARIRLEANMDSNA
jgi:hypothetical protein